MDFYISWKAKHFGVSEAFSHFDTLLWMWVLSWMFVKIIELREMLHKERDEVLTHKQALEIRETELRTMNEVVMTLKHQINNPLAIILGYIRLTLKKNTDEEIAKKLSEIEIAAQRINTAMKEFSLIEIYKTTDSPVGKLVQLPSDEKKSPAT
jgi:signal transduction histidine kinase